MANDVIEMRHNVHKVPVAGDRPSLHVYTPVTVGPTFVEDITPYAIDYSHSIRLLGGYWTASWKMSKAKTATTKGLGATLYDQWRSNRFFYHFVEKYQGTTTWEGSIDFIQPDDDKGIIDVTAYGYVHSIQNRYNAIAASTDDADVIIELLRSTYCQYISAGYMQANTLHVSTAGRDKVWSEMLKIVEIGDAGSSNPWSLGVYQDRRLHYQRVSATPVGYVRGGIRWRVDMPNDLINCVVVSYTDEAGAAQADIIAELPASQAVYGIRALKLTRTYIPTASATNLAAAYLYAHEWPYMRAVGCGRDIQVYDSIGCNRAYSPWTIQPGVFADTTMTYGAGLYQSWLTDKSHFLADEVVATQKGVSLRTSKWTEADMIDAYFEYAHDTEAHD